MCEVSTKMLVCANGMPIKAQEIVKFEFTVSKTNVESEVDQKPVFFFVLILCQKWAKNYPPRIYLFVAICMTLNVCLRSEVEKIQLLGSLRGDSRTQLFKQTKLFAKFY